MMVKICGITNREDALAAVDAGASAIGVQFLSGKPSIHFTYGRGAYHREDSLPGVEGGCFVNEPPDNIARIMLDAASTSLSCTDLPTLAASCLARSIGLRPLAMPLDETVEAVLLDLPVYGIFVALGETWTGRRLRILPTNHHRRGIGRQQRPTSLSNKPPAWGVDACSRIEKSPA